MSNETARIYTTKTDAIGDAIDCYTTADIYALIADEIEYIDILDDHYDETGLLIGYSLTDDDERFTSEVDAAIERAETAAIPVELANCAVNDAVCAALEGRIDRDAVTVYVDPEAGGIAWMRTDRSYDGDYIASGGAGWSAENYGDRYDDNSTYDERIAYVLNALEAAGFTVAR